MWRNLLVAMFHEHVNQNLEMAEEISRCDQSNRWDSYDWHCAAYIGKTCCQWITEASALSANGMPAGSFSLVLDGDPAPDQSSKVFEILKEDAAWQVAQAQWYTDQSLSPGLLATKIGGLYWSEVFPQAINNIVEGKSFMRCNFPTGNLYDPKRVLNRNGHLNHDPIRDPRLHVPGAKWMREWLKLRYHNPILPSPPLSLLADFALEDVIPEEEQSAV